MEKLIERLEAVPTGNGDLSWAVAEAMGWTRYWSMYTIYLPPGVTEEQVDGDSGATTDPPQYTTSLDAALTLVPDGMAVDVHIGPGAMANDATVFEPRRSVDEQGRRVTAYHPHEAKAVRDGVMHWNSPPLAVCIAALRARATAPLPDNQGSTSNTDSSTNNVGSPMRSEPATFGGEG